MSSNFFSFVLHDRILLEHLVDLACETGSVTPCPKLQHYGMKDVDEAAATSHGMNNTTQTEVFKY